MVLHKETATCKSRPNLNTKLRFDIDLSSTLTRAQKCTVYTQTSMYYRAFASEGLAQDPPILWLRLGFEPTTCRRRATSFTTAPSCRANDTQANGFASDINRVLPTQIDSSSSDPRPPVPRYIIVHSFCVRDTAV